MATNKAWSNTSPASGDDPRLGDDEIRNAKEAIQERSKQGGHYFPPTGVTASDDEGKHVCGEDGSTGDFTVYESDAHAGDRATKAVQISDAGGTTADTVILGDGRAGGTGRQYTLDTYTINANNVDLDAGLTVDGSTILGTGAADGTTCRGNTTFQERATFEDEVKYEHTTVTTTSHNAGEEHVIRVDTATAGGDVTVNMPDAAAANSGFQYSISNVAGTDNVIVTPDASDTIAGAATLTLRPKDSVTIQSDGTSEWFRVSDGGPVDAVTIGEATSTAGHTITSSMTAITGASQAITTRADRAGNVLIMFQCTVKIVHSTTLANGVDTVSFRIQRGGSTIATFTQSTGRKPATTTAGETYHRAFIQYLDPGSGLTPNTAYTYTVDGQKNAASTATSIVVHTTQQSLIALELPR